MLSSCLKLNLHEAIFSLLKEDRSRLYGAYYCKLIAVTTSDSYQTPRMNECIELLGHKMLFLSLDATEDIEKRRLPRKIDIKLLLPLILGSSVSFAFSSD